MQALAADLPACRQSVGDGVDWIHREGDGFVALGDVIVTYADVKASRARLGNRRKSDFSDQASGRK